MKMSLRFGQLALITTDKSEIGILASLCAFVIMMPQCGIEFQMKSSLGLLLGGSWVEGLSSPRKRLITNLCEEHEILEGLPLKSTTKA